MRSGIYREGKLEIGPRFQILFSKISTITFGSRLLALKGKNEPGLLIDGAKFRVSRCVDVC